MINMTQNCPESNSSSTFVWKGHIWCAPQWLSSFYTDNNLKVTQFVLWGMIVSWLVMTLQHSVNWKKETQLKANASVISNIMIKWSLLGDTQ